MGLGVEWVAGWLQVSFGVVLLGIKPTLLDCSGFKVRGLHHSATTPCHALLSQNDSFFKKSSQRSMHLYFLERKHLRNMQIKCGPSG